jgi:hypothetical protein
MTPREAELYRGDSTVISVRLDVDDGECVNVVDGVITYEAGIEPVDVSRGNSILSIWVEDPVINRDEKTITFAGGIPNGYCGRITGDPRLTNTVLELVVASPGFVVGSNNGNATPTAAFAFANETQVYLNDGTGEQAPLTTYGSMVTLLPKTGSSLRNDWQAQIAADTQPPNPFSINLESSDNAFSGRYFITFNTTDKQTGIDHYEVIEEPLEQLSLFMWGAEDAPWREARSPYLLRDQTLNSTIRVRAIDKAGNEYVATLVPDESQRTMRTETYILMGLLITAIAVVGGAALFFLVRWWRRRQADESDVYDVSDDELDEEYESDEEYDAEDE